MSHTVDIPKAVKDELKKFRFAKSNGISALVAKVNKRELIIQIEETYNDLTLEELVEELPESSPRYILLSYKFTTNDGRVTNPLVLINWVPPSCEMSLLTLHASAWIEFEQLADASKVFDVRDGAEGLTEETLKAHLGR